MTVDRHRCSAGCGCDPLEPAAPVVQNAPGQPRLVWRTSPHEQALRRLRARLGAVDQEPDVRALAGNATDDPTVAMLDAFAVVADTVSFYTERLAQEYFLRTATELESVRQLARTLGYELRPGVAAEVELAFDLEDAPGAPTSADIPIGTAARSIPGKDELPQVFETSEDLRAEAAWNAIEGLASEPAIPVFGDEEVWLEGTALGLQVGDALLLLGEERRRFGRTPDHVRAAGLAARDDERWEFRNVTSVAEQSGVRSGWTRVGFDRRVGWRRGTPLTPQDDVEVMTFRRRAALFGAQAPDPSLLVQDGSAPIGAETDPADATRFEWIGIGDPRVGSWGRDPDADTIEVDGDQARLVSGSWLVLERAGMTELYGIEDVAPAGGTRFGLSGKLQHVRVDFTENLAAFGRRETVVHCEPRRLPGGRRPVTSSLPADNLRLTLRVRATNPPLPEGRLVMVTGFAPGSVPADPILRAATPPPLAEPATVLRCDVTGDEMLLTFTAALTYDYDAVGLRVRGNVAAATHGESVQQVLGSGDSTRTFQRMLTRRAPLTHVRAATATGAQSTLAVRVDDVLWEETQSLDVVGPVTRAYVARATEDATVTVTTGDGRTGARPPTGSENVVATYRVGIGATGALVPGQLSLLPRRPLGVRSVSNPAPTQDWAPPESLGDARANAPLRTRTLDRAVSVADHEDFAAGFAGVSLARADNVWNGRTGVVVVSVLGTAGQTPGDGLITDLGEALRAARDPSSPFLVVAGTLVRLGIRLDLLVDPAYARADVEAAVTAALQADFTAPALAFATPVTASRALVTVKAIPGVVACTIPGLAAVTSQVGAPTVLAPAGVDVLAPLPARWDPGVGGSPAGVVAAQAATLVAEGVQIGVMAP